MTPESLVWVVGHRGLVGSAILRNLEDKGFKNFVFSTRDTLELRDQAAVQAFMEESRPEYIFLAAAKVGGIKANSDSPAEFLYDNLMIETNIINSAHRTGVKKLLFLGSTCIYPKFAEQPIVEDSLLTGSLEPTNEWYAIAKIAGIKLCQSYRQQYGSDFITAMPTNLYGPDDNFDLSTSHVLPALMRKFHEAKSSDANTVVVWGSGKPKREFMHVDDCADACVHLMMNYSDPGIVNVGVGEDLSIGDLAGMIGDVVGFGGEIEFDASMPDGTPRKLTDTSRLAATGWQPRIPLREGVADTYSWYVKNADS